MKRLSKNGPRASKGLPEASVVNSAWSKIRLRYPARLGAKTPNTVASKKGDGNLLVLGRASNLAHLASYLIKKFCVAAKCYGSENPNNSWIKCIAAGGARAG